MKVCKLWGFSNVTLHGGRLWLNRYAVEWEFWGSSHNLFGGGKLGRDWCVGASVKRGPSLFLYKLH